ncbi:hypothetical protein ABKA04_008226 [Annulohypoxylon sp. FPYF3050]
MEIVSPGNQVCNSEALPPSALTFGSQSPPPGRRSWLTSIPLEVRFMIYEYVFDGNFYDCFSYHVAHFHRESCLADLIHKRPTKTSPLDLLLVCKQIHDEVATGLYKRITLEFDLGRWVSALNKIGPRYGSLIQQVEIVHECWECHRRSGHDGAMWNCLLEPPGTLDNPDLLLNCLAANNVNPEYLKIKTYSLLSFPSAVDHFTAKDNDPIPETSNADINQHNHSNHQLYHDQKFINQLFCICKNVRRIDFHGAFNPLWALDLNKKLEFIIKIDYPFEDVNALEPSCGWTLINPKSVDLSNALQSYKPSDSNNRVYIKLPDYLHYAIKREGLIKGNGYMTEKSEDDIAKYQPSGQSLDSKPYALLLYELIRFGNFLETAEQV